MLAVLFNGACNFGGWNALMLVMGALIVRMASLASGE